MDAKGKYGQKEKSGRGSHQQIFGMRVILPSGYASIPYGFLRSLPWMDNGQTRIELLVEGYHRQEDWKLGLWLVVIKGKNLEKIFDAINVSKREWTQAGDDDDGTTVDGVEIREFDE